MLSLMQMAKISAALARLRDGAPALHLGADRSDDRRRDRLLRHAGRPQHRRAGALIGFAGPRVIEQTIRQSLPEGFQRSEFLLEHGFLDLVVQRSEMKETLAPVPAAPDVATPTRRHPLAGSRRSASSSASSARAPCSTALGDPQRRFPAVLVAGTNGKGSTSALLAAIGPAAGYRTGLYTSPHLEVVEERLRIDGRTIAPGRFGELLAGLVDLAERETGAPPTYFEAVTLAAFQWFAEEGVDLAVRRGRPRRPARRHQPLRSASSR